MILQEMVTVMMMNMSHHHVPQPVLAFGVDVPLHCRKRGEGDFVFLMCCLNSGPIDVQIINLSTVPKKSARVKNCQDVGALDLSLGRAS